MHGGSLEIVVARRRPSYPQDFLSGLRYTFYTMVSAGQGNSFKHIMTGEVEEESLNKWTYYVAPVCPNRLENPASGGFSSESFAQKI